MHRFAVLAFIAACDLQPPPPKAAPPTTPVVKPAAGSNAAPVAVPPTPPVTPPVAPPVTPPVAPPGVTIDAGLPPLARPDGGTHATVTQACLDVGVKFAQLVVESKLGERGILEQERTKTVKDTSESCADQHWTQQTIDCFLSARTYADAQVCSRALKAATP